MKMGGVNLPNGWATTSLENVCAVMAGNPAPQGEEFFENGAFNFVRVQDMGRLGDVTYLRETKDRINKRAIPKLRLFPKGSVLFTKSGASTLNNQRAILGKDCYVVSHIAAAIPENGISSEWIYFALVCVDFADLAHSSVMPSLPLSKVKPIQVLIPPTNEQHRIVAKIEELFSELDKGIENLKTARAQLKVYRQALLKHAFEGKLTAQWRAENQDKLETADALQKRIQQERAQRYQQQLADWEAADKQGSKPKAPKPQPPLTKEELAELPELPEGWGWFKIAHVCDVVRGGSPRPAGDPKFYGGDIPFLKVADITNTSTPYLRSFTFTITKAGLSKTRQIEPNTLLLSNSGATLGVPRICLISATMNDGVAAFLGLPHHSLLYHYYFWESKTEHLRNINQGAAQPNLNTDLIKETFIPICSPSEQSVVIQKLEAVLSEVDQLDQTLTTSLQQAESLRQSILKKAFSGQLVAQDANDEPASALLTRIKAEKSALGAMAKPRKPQQVHAQAAPAKPNVIPFPVKIGNISATDLHAGILALAYRYHEQNSKHLAYFGHVKAEKIAHLVEAHLGIDLERVPIKDAAGPNDYPHLKKVESRARKTNWFEVRQQQTGVAYVFLKKQGFDALLDKTANALGERVADVDALLKLLLPLSTKQAEIVATLYAAWNNLLLLGRSPQDEDIVYEARENWHESKLKIDREKFFKGLEWMRNQGLVPAGRGRYVSWKGKRKTTGKSE